MRRAKSLATVSALSHGWRNICARWARWDRVRPSSPNLETRKERNAMADVIYDVVIIGGGPGGYVAAIRAAQLGLKTGLVEREWLGGVCLNIGCIPTKSLLKNAAVVDELNHAKDWGISFENFKADYSAAQARSRQVSSRLVKGVEFLMRKNKIDVIMDEAFVRSAQQVELKKGGQTLTAKNLIVATGARPR